MTFTLIARNPFTRQLGLAMASGSDDCLGGSLVASLASDAAHPAFAVVQGKADDAVRARIAEAYGAGQGFAEIMDDLRVADSVLPLRQIVMAGFDQPLVAYTGDYCAPWAGQHLEEHLVIAGNMLASPNVLARMRKAYMGDLHAPMRRRLLAALSAGVAAGGDKRGHASAAIVIAGSDPFCLSMNAVADPVQKLAENIS